MRIATVVGARPQFIKAAPLCRALDGMRDVAHVLVHTGQHFDDGMSDVFFRELEIPAPDRHLGIGSGSHGAQTGRMVEALEAALVDYKPDCVVVVGDTNSTLAGALTAAKLGLPVAHVEAGLRSFNRGMPEEINRVVADHVSSVLLAPTEAAVANLRAEGIEGARVRLVGDVMYDAALFYGHRAEERSRVLERLGLRGREYVLATIHRAENTDDAGRLAEIFHGLARVAKRIAVVLPLHPRTRKALDRVGWKADGREGLIVTEPVGYLDMVALERGAAVIVTDSGGVQKEALFYRVPCVTCREETEWVETVELGANCLVGAAANRIEQAVLERIGERVSVADAGALYGGGRAAERIVAVLLEGPAWGR